MASRFQFESPVKIADGGGGLIEARDVNGDGRMDIVSPQFFAPVQAQPFVPAVARDASVASYVWFENNADGSFTRHAIGTNQWPVMALAPCTGWSSRTMAPSLPINCPTVMDMARTVDRWSRI